MKGAIQKMKTDIITSQFRPILVCCLCFLFTIVMFSVSSIAASTKNVLILGNNVVQVEAETISKNVKKVQNFTFDYEVTKDTKLAKADAS